MDSYVPKGTGCGGILLTLEQNPAIRLASVESIREHSGRWMVGHTKSRQEKAFAFECTNHRDEYGHQAPIPYFLPMCKMRREHNGIKRTVLVPIFPSYVFFAGDGDTRYEALATNRLCQVIPVTDQKILIGELLQIERVIDMDLKIELYPELAIGVLARVRRGPLEGTTGTIVEDKGEFRLVLQVGMLGQGAGLEIDKELLEPI